MKRERGFSLIEVVISILILAIGIVGVIGAYNSYIKADTKAKIYTMELALARDKMEELMSSTALSKIATPTPVVIPYEGVGDGYEFVMETTVTDVTLSSLSTPVWEIKVLVYKKSKKEKKGGVELIARREK